MADRTKSDSQRRGIFKVFILPVEFLLMLKSAEFNVNYSLQIW